MDPNQQSTPRGDYQSVPVDRPRNYLESAAPADSAPPPPESLPSDMPLPQPVEPSPVQFAAPEVITPTDAAAVPPEPLLEAPDPEPLLAAHTSAPVSAPIESVEAQTPARPFQIASPESKKSAFWKTQKFWLIATSTAFVVLLLLGSLSWYKATHHKADTKIPVTAVASVDTSSNVKHVGGSANEKAANDQRQEEILSLRSYLEAYYTSKLYYPTTAEMTNPAWTIANIEGLTAATMQDPDGTKAALAATPTKGQYAYQAGIDKNMGACDNVSQNCNYYILTAILSDNTPYVKTALR